MKETKKILETLEKHSEMETLKALQSKIAATIDESKSGRDIAALSKQLREVTARIAEIEEVRKNGDTVIDEIRKKHAAMRVR